MNKFVKAICSEVYIRNILTLQVSESLADPVVPRLLFTFLPFLIHFVDKSNGADNIRSIDLVAPTVINLFPNHVLLHDTRVACQFFNELEGVDHLL